MLTGKPARCSGTSGQFSLSKAGFQTRLSSSLCVSDFNVLSFSHEIVKIYKIFDDDLKGFEAMDTVSHSSLANLYLHENKNVPHCVNLMVKRSDLVRNGVNLNALQRLTFRDKVVLRSLIRKSPDSALNRPIKVRVGLLLEVEF